MARNSAGRTRRGAFYVDYDVSSLQDGLSGITAHRLMSMPEFKKISLHYGLVAKEQTVRATRAKVPNDPREAWRAVSLGYSDKRGAPILYLGINEKRTVDKRPWNPRKKGTRGERYVSQGTRNRNAYFGRSRAFVLRWVLGGTQARTTGPLKRKGGTKGKTANRGRIKKHLNYYVTAKRSLLSVSADWLRETRELVEQKFGRSK